MKTILFILISFQSLAQDSIPCPCDLTRQQTRLFFSAYEKKLKLADDQHERENTKEIKSLKYGVKALRIENKTIRKEFELKEDSIKRSFNLAMKKEQNVSKSLRNDKNALQIEYKIFKRKSKSEDLAKRTEIRKLRTIIYGLAIFAALVLLFLIYVKFRRK